MCVCVCATGEIGSESEYERDTDKWGRRERGKERDDGGREQEGGRRRDYDGSIFGKIISDLPMSIYLFSFLSQFISLI